jgi:hypothetical protein
MHKEKKEDQVEEVVTIAPETPADKSQTVEPAAKIQGIKPKAETEAARKRSRKR